MGIFDFVKTRQITNKQVSIYPLEMYLIIECCGHAWGDWRYHLRSVWHGTRETEAPIPFYTLELVDLSNSMTIIEMYFVDSHARIHQNNDNLPRTHRSEWQSDKCDLRSISSFIVRCRQVVFHLQEFSCVSAFFFPGNNKSRVIALTNRFRDTQLTFRTIGVLFISIMLWRTIVNKSHISHVLQCHIIQFVTYAYLCNI